MILTLSSIEVAKLLNNVDALSCLSHYNVQEIHIVVRLSQLCQHNFKYNRMAKVLRVMLAKDFVQYSCIHALGILGV